MSSALFATDENGAFNLASKPPITRSCHKVDPMGLFWSMRSASKKFPALFLAELRKSFEIELIAEIDVVAVGGARLQRRFAADGVLGEPVHEQGLVGAFYHPAGSGPYSAVIVLGGSDGNLSGNQAALLASYGYAALALRYFGATFPAIKAVVVCSFSGLVQAGIERGYTHTAWKYHGKPFQQAVVMWTPLLWFKLMWQCMTQQAFPLCNLFLATLNDRKHLDEATIPVENIQGPILLISGDYDRMFPSTLYSALIMQRLAEHHHPHADQHLLYQCAGHFMSFPYGSPISHHS